MLMNRAFIEFSERVKRDGKRDSVRLISTIHDATYLLIKEDMETIQWVNKHLIECMNWQKAQKLQSPITIEAELDVGPDWAHQVTLPNNATVDEIKKLLA